MSPIISSTILILMFTVFVHHIKSQSVEVTCPSQRITDYYMAIPSIQATWLEATYYCIFRFNTSLATANESNVDQTNELLNITSDGPTYWIGAYNNTWTQQIEWLTKDGYMDCGECEYRCQALNAVQNPDFIEIDCSSRHRFICNRPPQYHAVSDKMAFYEAEQYCQDKGSHLVSIHDSDTNDLIHKILVEKGAPSSGWIGLNFKTKLWTDGSILDYEPDLQSSFTSTWPECSVMSITDAWKRWTQLNCNYTYHFVCGPLRRRLKTQTLLTSPYNGLTLSVTLSVNVQNILPDPAYILTDPNLDSISIALQRSFNENNINFIDITNMESNPSTNRRRILEDNNPINKAKCPLSEIIDNTENFRFASSEYTFDCDTINIANGVIINCYFKTPESIVYHWNLQDVDLIIKSCGTTTMKAHIITNNSIITESNEITNTTIFNFEFYENVELTQNTDYIVQINITENINCAINVTTMQINTVNAPSSCKLAKQFAESSEMKFGLGALCNDNLTQVTINKFEQQLFQQHSSQHMISVKTQHMLRNNTNVSTPTPTVITRRLGDNDCTCNPFAPGACSCPAPTAKEPMLNPVLIAKMPGHLLPKPIPNQRTVLTFANGDSIEFSAPFPSVFDPCFAYDDATQ
eukprot:11957_1